MPLDKIPRPPNAFILYRSYIIRLRNLLAPTLEDNKTKRQGEISKIVSNMWKKERPEVKDRFKRRAALKALQHKADFPDYRYCPTRGKGKKGAPRRAGVNASERPTSVVSVSGSTSPSSEPVDAFQDFLSSGEISSQLGAASHQWFEEESFSDLCGAPSFSQIPEHFASTHEYRYHNAIPAMKYSAPAQPVGWHDYSIWPSSGLTEGTMASSSSYSEPTWNIPGSSHSASGVEYDPYVAQKLQQELLDIFTPLAPY